MRTWKLPSPSDTTPASGMAQASCLLAGLVEHLGQGRFAQAALSQLSAIVPTASLSVYRIGSRPPRLFMSASQGVPDTTHQCWNAYLSGPQHEDRSWGQEWLGRMPDHGARNLVHVQASEVTPLHRLYVYDAFGHAVRVPYSPSASLAYLPLHQPPLAYRKLALAI